MAGHSICAPSGAHRWLKCPGSMIYELTLPGTESEYAREGTLAHALATECLVAGRKARNVTKLAVDFGDGKGPLDTDIPKDMHEPVQSYIDNCKKYANYDLFLVEQSIDLTDVLGGEIRGEKQGGTSDLVAFNIKLRHLVCRDLKYGMGKIVSAVENEQEMLYVAGVIEFIENTYLVDVDKVTLEIDQPRINFEPSVWETTGANVKAWAEMVRNGAPMQVIRHIAENIGKDDFEIDPKWFQAGKDVCQFCKGRTPERLCPFMIAEAEDALGAEFSDLDALKEVKQAVPCMTDEELGRKLKGIDLVSSIIDLLWSTARMRMENGIKVPGWKLVAGRMGARKWTDEKAVDGVLTKMKFHTLEKYDTKLKSVAEIEKICQQKDSKVKWKKLQEYITQSGGKPSIVDENDPKPELVIGAADDFFKDLDETGSAIAAVMGDEVKEAQAAEDAAIDLFEM